MNKPMGARRPPKTVAESEALLRGANSPGFLDTLDGIFWFAAGLSLLAMIAQLAYQLYLYLRQGRWVEFSATDACATYLHVQWCAYPTDWVGVHEIASGFSAPGLLLMVSGGLAFALSLRH